MSTETVTADRVVAINYELRDDAGEELDSSEGEPLAYLHGHNNIIPGLEQALEGLKPGDQKQVTVQPEAGYGAHQSDLVFALPRAQFDGQTPEPDMMLQLRSSSGEEMMARIISVDEQKITLDANHPLAGKTLHFGVEIVSIRPASAEEIAHGHPHGPEGHAH
jgi:FKBP-type peptidyl-prolyl cis-trans isomerase SlyD